MTIDLMGKRFGRLLVVDRAGSTPNRNARWLCLCDCGSYRTTIGESLRSGATRSCGCLQKEEQAARVRLRNFKHGQSANDNPTRTYKSYNSMIARCYNPKQISFRYYGGRGITVCDEWRNDFKAFFAVMGERPVGKTLDRIDNNGNYEPGNCRWATPSEQAYNRRRPVKSNG